MRPFPALIAPLLLLAGCNLFRSAEIPTTCEDLPGGCGGIDTEPQPDDTGDTAPYVYESPYTKGIALVTVGSDTVNLRAYGSDGELLTEAGLPLSDCGVPGPVAYDPAGPAFYLWDRGYELLWVWADGADPFSVKMENEEDASTAVQDLEVVDGVPYLVTPDGLWAYSAADQSLSKLGNNDAFYAVSSVFFAFEDNVFLLDHGADEQPDIWRFTLSTGESRLFFEDFDASPGRAAQGFLGAENSPWVCSTVGGVYSAETLQGGDLSPAAFPNQDQLAELCGGAVLLAEVTDCAYDAGAERYLLHSAIHGVLSMDAWGRLERLHDADGETLARAYFFDPVEVDSDTQ